MSNTDSESRVPSAARGGAGGRLRRPGGDAGQGRESPYDAIARVYDPWSASVTEDLDFYVEEAKAAGGRVVELACGTGRVAVPVAKAGVPVIGVDGSAAMLDV